MMMKVLFIMGGVLFLIVGVAAVLYLGWLVHCGLGRLCVWHAVRFCRRRGLEIRRVRWQPEFEPSGVKTEYTLVQMEAEDAQKKRRLVQLAVWPFGVRRMVSEEAYPESEEGLESGWKVMR